MKMVKSALLAGAAGLITVAGAHAADLPLKAKPVEYVKVCSIYGAGFFYIPGTDTCLKIGGYLRFETDYRAGGTFAPPVGPAGRADQHNWAFDRTSTELLTRSRMLWTYDVRTQTEYGTLRSYARTGIQWTTGDSVLVGSGAQGYLDRAFIQFGGFTFGKGLSFFESYNLSLHSYSSYQIGTDGAAGNGTPQIAYTFNVGNGISASLALEESYARGKSVVNVNGSGYFSLNNASGAGTGPLSAQAGNLTFDGVGNLRIDQVWGYASISGAVHQVKGLYYGFSGANNAPFGGDPGFIAAGHPSDKLGYAVQAGTVLNLPWSKGDTFGVSAAYGVGALGYVDGSGLGSVAIFRGGSVGLGFLTDAVYGSATNAGAGGSALELTTGWSVVAGLEHYWTPALRTSLYGGFTQINYNANATALICSGTGFAGLGRTSGAAVGFTPTNCSPNFSFFQIGSRTIWNPAPNLDLGLELMYNRVQTAFAGAATTAATATPALPAIPAPAAFNVADQGVLSAVFRVQRNFWP
jgi:hypothetical protein